MITIQSHTRFQQRRSILAFSADKGNATVVMETVDYKTKINGQLDPNTYKELAHDRTLNEKTKMIKNSSTADKLRRKYAKRSSSSITLRPIVPTDCRVMTPPST